MSFRIRDATPADIAALAALHVETFNETHRAGQPGGPSYQLRRQQWHDAFSHIDGGWFCLVVENDEGHLVGFAKGTAHDAGVPGFQGELNKIYLLQRVQGQGLGRQLLCKVAERFLHQGIPSMLLFGDATSPSNGFYEACGGGKLYAANGEFHGGYGWRDLRTLLQLCDST